MRVGLADRMVNLEEIWRNGAVFDSEEEVEQGALVEIGKGETLLKGQVTRVEAHEFGWLAEVRFSPETPWRLDLFRPQHLLEVR